jgi:hypothetical protein
MTEMTRRAGIMAASRKQRADRLPFFHYWRHSQIGWAEREARNRGMGMCWVRPSFGEAIHGVEVTDQYTTLAGRGVVRRIYKTPVGAVTSAEVREPGTGQWHGGRSWKDVSPWQVERLIKGPEDYRVVKYMVEHTEYTADYFPVEQALDWLGEDGVVLDALPHSPLQTLMIDWIGSDEGRFFYHHVDYPDLVEELYQALCIARAPMYDIVAASPAQITMHGDNIDGFLVNPRLFRRYFMPVYEQQARALHRHNKLLAVHMDGRVNNLKELIAETPIDIVEALPPPPMGDLPLREALAVWTDKAIWVSMPGGIYELGPAETTGYTVELLREAIPGERLVINMSAENLVSNENLLAVTAVLEHAALPLTLEEVERIARAL